MSAQVEQIDSVLDGIDSIEDLDDFEDDLRRVMRKYDYQDRRAERDIEYRRDAILEGRVRLFRPGYGSVDRSEEEEDASDEEIRSMFRGLPR
jgi:molecular chaperone GrpE (heat shock protein)